MTQGREIKIINFDYIGCSRNVIAAWRDPRIRADKCEIYG